MLDEDKEVSPYEHVHVLHNNKYDVSCECKCCQ